MLAVGQRYRTREPLNIVCWWWYDTAAILDDYSDSCESVLPAGEAFTVRQIPDEAPDRILCDLDYAKRLKRLLIPKGRQIKILLGCYPTPYQVEISRADIESKCEALPAGE
jgi:hypothetical protein